MARIQFNPGDDYMLKLRKLAERSPEMIDKAIGVGAGIITDQIRANLEANLAGSTESTGSLSESLGITPIETDSRGFRHAKIGFSDPDYDEKGTPNLLKARIMESGTSKIQKRPFIRPAVNAKRKEAEAEMERVIDEEVKKVMGK